MKEATVNINTGQHKANKTYMSMPEMRLREDIRDQLFWISFETVTTKHVHNKHRPKTDKQCHLQAPLFVHLLFEVVFRHLCLPML